VWRESKAQPPFQPRCRSTHGSARQSDGPLSHAGQSPVPSLPVRRIFASMPPPLSRTSILSSVGAYASSTSIRLAWEMAKCVDERFAPIRYTSSQTIGSTASADPHESHGSRLGHQIRVPPRSTRMPAGDHWTRRSDDRRPLTELRPSSSPASIKSSCPAKCWLRGRVCGHTIGHDVKLHRALTKPCNSVREAPGQSVCARQDALRIER